MQCLPSTKAGCRYTRRLAVTMLCYLAFMFLAGWSFHHLHPTGFIVYLLAVLPALPLVASLAVIGVYIAGERVALGEGRSKQEAEQDAAQKALAAKGWS